MAIFLSLYLRFPFIFNLLKIKEYFEIRTIFRSILKKRMPGLEPNLTIILSRFVQTFPFFRIYCNVHAKIINNEKYY